MPDLNIVQTEKKSERPSYFDREKLLAVASEEPETEKKPAAAKQAPAPAPEPVITPELVEAVETMKADVEKKPAARPKKPTTGPKKAAEEADAEDSLKTKRIVFLVTPETETLLDKVIMAKSLAGGSRASRSAFIGDLVEKALEREMKDPMVKAILEIR